MVRPVLALALAAQLLPLTALVVDVPVLPDPRAGEAVQLEGTVHREGPAGPLPGLGEEVNLTLEAPWQAGCRLVNQTVELEPLSEDAPFQVACTPKRPGSFELAVNATDGLLAEGAWNASLDVAPDVLTGQLEIGSLSGFHAPVNLSLAPEHLERAPVNVSLVSELQGTPLSFATGPVAWNATSQAVLEEAWTARHGPGTYDLTARVNGPWTEPYETTAKLHVPEPEANATIVLEVTVVPGSPEVGLQDDAINDDGKTKRPGDTLTTRLHVDNATRVNLTVLRAGDPEPVPIAEQTLPVPADGNVEHTFSHAVLPTGTLTVVAQAGESQVARTAEIQDAAADATVATPEPVLADGRPINVSFALLDENHGSTALDPGPIFGLPALSWRTFRGSLPVEGWTSSLGPHEGTGEGQAATDRVAWPQGTSWATVQDGRAELELTLRPPPEIEAGSYRVSIYEEPGGDRLGGTDLELVQAPSVTLDPGQPVPGQGLPVNLTVHDPVAGTEVRLDLRSEGQLLDTATVAGSGLVDLALPDPLGQGQVLNLTAWATWPGRPQVQDADAQELVSVPDLAPELVATASLDGRLLPAPLPLHPAGQHRVEAAVVASDPNGQAVDVSARAVDPSGAPTAWQPSGGEVFSLIVPADQPPGRYGLEIIGTAGNLTTTERIDLDIAPVSRITVAGPDQVQVPAGGHGTVNISVTNAGSQPVSGVLVTGELPDALDGHVRSDGATAGFGEVLPTAIEPGQSRDVEVRIHAPPEATGAADVALTIAGVLG